MRFDAYNCTFRSDALQEVSEALVTVLGAVLIPLKKGIHGYKAAQLIEVAGVNHGVIAYGGRNIRPFVEVKGEPAHAWSEFVRNRAFLDSCPTESDIAEAFIEGDYETHAELAQARQDFEAWAHLTRADVCFDWLDERDAVAMAPALRGAVEAACRLSASRPPQWDQRGDWESLEGRKRGCTLYMGASSSAIRVRLYDKGAELQGKKIEAPDNLRRMEIQCRPSTKEEKRSWVLLPADSFWLLSPSVKACASFVGIQWGTQSPERCPSPPAEMERLKTLASVQYGDAVVDLIRELLGAEFARKIREEVDRRREIHSGKKSKAA